MMKLPKHTYPCPRARAWLSGAARAGPHVALTALFALSMVGVTSPVAWLVGFALVGLSLLAALLAGCTGILGSVARLALCLGLAVGLARWAVWAGLLAGIAAGALVAWTAPLLLVQWALAAYGEWLDQSPLAGAR